MVTDLNKLQAVEHAKRIKERKVNLGMCVLQIKYFAISCILIYFDRENYSCLMSEYPVKFSP